MRMIFQISEEIAKSDLILGSENSGMVHDESVTHGRRVHGLEPLTSSAFACY